MFDYQRVAIILPERLGDTIFHTPSIKLLRKMRPDIRIEIIALSALAAGVVENNPNVNAIYVAPSDREMKRMASRYDVVMNIHNHAASRRCVEVLGIPSITAVPSPHVKHQAAHSLAFFQQLLKCEIQPGEDRYTLFPGVVNHTKIDALLRAQDYVSERDILIGCHIGCHSIAKKGWKIWQPLTHPKVWPLQNFIELEAALRRANPRIRLVLTGSAAETRLGAQFMRAAPRTINLIGHTSVVDFAALMDRLALFVTPDTGTLHAACATNVGIIALFGPTSLEGTGPYPMRDNYRILQAEKINDISAAQVCGEVLLHPAIASAATQ